MNLFNRSLAFLREHKWKVLSLFACVLVPLLIFGKLADRILDGGTISFDEPIQLWVRSYKTLSLDRTMLTLSAYGSPPLMFTMCGVVTATLLWLKRRGDALFFFLSIGGAALLNVAGKLFFGRARPDLWVSIDPRADFSFPSGHAMGTMAVYGALVFIVWPDRWRTPFAFACAMLVFAIGLSRVYLGVHFPSDILAGWIASFVWVFGLYRIRQLRRGRGEFDRTPVN